MGKFKLIFISSIVIIAIVILAINMVIRQSEREIISTGQGKITVGKEVTVKKENTRVQAKRAEEPPPRIIPPGEVQDN